MSFFSSAPFLPSFLVLASSLLLSLASSCWTSSSSRQSSTCCYSCLSAYNNFFLLSFLWVPHSPRVLVVVVVRWCSTCRPRSSPPLTGRQTFFYLRNLFTRKNLFLSHASGSDLLLLLLSTPAHHRQLHQQPPAHMPHSPPFLPPAVVSLYVYALLSLPSVFLMRPFPLFLRLPSATRTTER